MSFGATACSPRCAVRAWHTSVSRETVASLWLPIAPTSRKRSLEPRVKERFFVVDGEVERRGVFIPGGWSVGMHLAGQGGLLAQYVPWQEPTTLVSLVAAAHRPD